MTDASVAVDATGAATVAGLTASTNFPTTAGAYDTSYNGGSYDAFVARLNAAGNGLLYATYLGGRDRRRHFRRPGRDGGGDGRGDHLPRTSRRPPGRTTRATTGSDDVFVARLNAAGNALLYATYLGGAGSDRACSLALDATGAADGRGGSRSPRLPDDRGLFDAFVARLQFSPRFHTPCGLSGRPVRSIRRDPRSPGRWPSRCSRRSDVRPGRAVDARPALRHDRSRDPAAGDGGRDRPRVSWFDPHAADHRIAGHPLLQLRTDPAFLVGTTLHVQAVAVDASLPPLPPLADGLSTHGNAALPTPACQVTFVP